MRVQKHQRILIHPLAQLPDTFDVFEIILRKSEHRKAIGFCAVAKFARFRAHHQLRMAALAQAVGQQEQLPLAAAKLKARIDMRDAECSLRAQCLPLLLAWSSVSLTYLRRTYRAAIQAIRKPGMPSSTPSLKK